MYNFYKRPFFKGLKFIGETSRKTQFSTFHPPAFLIIRNSSNIINPHVKRIRMMYNFYKRPFFKGLKFIGETSRKTQFSTFQPPAFLIIRNSSNIINPDVKRIQMMYNFYKRPFFKGLKFIGETLRKAQFSTFHPPAFLIVQN